MEIMPLFLIFTSMELLSNLILFLPDKESLHIMQSIFPQGLDGSPGAIVASCTRRVTMQVSSKHHWSLATRWSIMHKRARFGQQRALSSSGATRKSEPPITREDWCEPGVMSAINSAVYAPLRQFRPLPPPQIAWNSDCCSANSIA